MQYDLLTGFGYYTGTVVGWERSFAHFSITEEGVVHGMIDNGVDGWHIEPAAKYAGPATGAEWD